MCTKENLTVFTLALNTMMQLCAAIIALMGFVLVLRSDWDVAYDGVPSAWGGGLILAAILLTSTACIAFYGTKRHNKCFLALATLTAVLCVIIEFSVAQNMTILLELQHPDETIESCLRSEDDAAGTLYGTDPALCDEVFASPELLRMARLYMIVYTESIEQETRKQELVDVETSNYCCGLGPAEFCDGTIITGRNNFTIQGEEILTAANPIDKMLSRCSQRLPPVWYLESFYCRVQAGDFFGCPYMFPTSTACLRDNNVRKGCLLAFQQHIEGQVRPIADTTFALIVVQTAAAIGSCCLCLKRKSFDVLPPPKPFTDPKYLKYAKTAEPNA